MRKKHEGQVEGEGKSEIEKGAIVREEENREPTRDPKKRQLLRKKTENARGKI